MNLSIKKRENNQLDVIDRNRLDGLRNVYDKLESNLRIIKSGVEKTYLPIIAEKYVPIPIPEKLLKFSYSHRVRIAQVKKWIIDKDEQSLDKLVNVYSALSGLDCSVTLVYRRVKTGVNVYFVIANQSEIIDPAVVDSYYNLFVSALKGNFPGAEIENVTDVGSYFDENAQGVTGEWFAEENCNAVSMITSIASESSDKFICQGIEKLLDGIVPYDNRTEYTIMLVAEPIGSTELEVQKAVLENAYTQLSPYEKIQETETRQESVTKTESVTKSITGSSTTGVNLIFVNGNKSISMSKSKSTSDAHTSSDSKSVMLTKTNYAVKELLEKIEKSIQRMQNGEAMGMWNFSSYVLADSYSVAQNVSNMYKSLIEGDDSFVETAAINIWNDNRRECKGSIDEILNYLKAFMHPSFMLKLPQNFISNENNNNKTKLNLNSDICNYPSGVMGSTQISGKELAMAMNLPNAAVSGLPVIETAAFGRDVISQSFGYGEKQSIDLGRIFHMQHEEQNRVLLDANCMTEHTFVTGSTGAGKSTTIYRILSEASKLNIEDDPIKKNVTFMVIEPAKGEYKNEISRFCYADTPVSIYDTNPNSQNGQLLKINPFAFPSKIHILEHLDRLIEIFNVCWPMYAAMPAVLKNGIEQAYKACGWDLLKSQNEFRQDIFPTFADVCNHIRAVIDDSEYSAENKGDYKGALVTRLESLTNGINGLIFSSNAISDSQLFDNNSIIDLSRVGSTETKALIMGLLVMKLQEYRMSSENRPNASLRHITVLEEAHNLLKSTSTEQSAEGSNLLGKSVEMLSNSIAEMRTYGEAFIIADQAPGLLDKSVIRNTNTKIIMRLPDYSDRELVGRAANLNDEQLVEIAKLRPGVAAVYYNGWINPVLCKVPYSKLNSDAAVKLNVFKEETYQPDKLMYKEILDVLLRRKTPENVDRIVDELMKAGFCSEFVFGYAQFCNAENKAEKKKLLPSLLYLFFKPEQILKKISNSEKAERLYTIVSERLGFDNMGISGKLGETVVLNLLHEQTIRLAGYDRMYSEFGNYFKNKYYGG